MNEEIVRQTIDIQGGTFPPSPLTEMEALREIVGLLDVISGSLFVISERQRTMANLLEQIADHLYWSK